MGDLDDFFIQETESCNEGTPRLGPYEPPEVLEARRLDRQGRVIRVLITVKTAPQPSRKYDDTVCVAGIALEPLRWVRLYPIPFRHLSPEHKFEKYSIISVRVTNSPNDPRFESLRVDPQTIKVEEVLKADRGWHARALYVENMEAQSLCACQQAISLDANGPSLAVVKPLEGTFSLELQPHEGWSVEQKARIAESLVRQSLPFEGVGRAYDVPELEPPRLKAWTRFKCTTTCGGHRIGFIDWEMVALQIHNKHLPIKKLEALINEKFAENPTREGKALRIYIGNQANATKRRSFEALGLYYPDIQAVANSAVLF